MVGYLVSPQMGRAFFASSPTWVGGLFALRNRIVALFGLKTSSAGEKETVINNFKWGGCTSCLSSRFTS